MEDPDLGTFGDASREIGLDTVDEDRDVRSDPTGLIDDVVTQAGEPGEQVLERRRDGLTFDVVIVPDIDGLGENPRKPETGRHPTRLTAPMRGNDGSSSCQASPLSSVSQTLPPVVPKQNLPSLSPSKAPLSTPVN